MTIQVILSRVILFNKFMNYLFPSELLEKSVNERIAYFRNEVRISHAKLTQALNEVTWAVKDGLAESLIYLYGPTGVGKTTLLNIVHKKILEEYESMIIDNSGILPVVRILADSPHTGNFDWKSFFKELLEIMMEPLIDYKDDLYRWKVVKDEYDKLKAAAYRATGGKYRTAFINAVKYRETKIMLADDGQHFGVVASGRKVLDQTNTIKSVAEKTQLIIAMFGTYEMLPLRNLNGQTSRRSVNIHFQRYNAEYADDIQGFKQALGTLQRYLPLEEMPDCENNWDFFMERSLGCIGILKDWLTKALAVSLRNNKKTISHEFLEKTSLSVHQCKEILSEIIQGETDLIETAEERFLLRVGLSLENGKQSANSNQENNNLKGKKKGNRKPGVQNPRRNKIGIENGRTNISK